MDALVRLFRRETSSTEFIPVIDGLRFLAILMVVFYHINAYVLEKSEPLTFIPTNSGFSLNIFAFGHQGVQLFFVISGFILAMPFMRQSFGLTEKQASLKQYYLRRLTRLEPPYVVSTLLLFLMLVFVVADKYSFNDLVSSLFASLFYLNNVIFPGEFPRINAVTWSLEIEVQFYLIAPVLVWAFCSVKSKRSRRSLMFLLIVAFTVLSWMMELVWHVRVISLASCFQYFLAGILLSDIYLLDSDKIDRLNGLGFALVGAGLLVFITAFEHSQTPYLVLRILSPLMILVFYLIAFGNRLWNRVFSFNGLTLIGGMCYTIYLLHYATISAIGRLTVKSVTSSNYYFYFTIQALIYLIAILIVSSAFFLLIEKPCMKRDWYLRFFDHLKAPFQNAKIKENT